jgi:hypothetical protein
MYRANHDLYVTYHLGGVMIIVITLDMVHHGFNVRSGITEDDAINNIVFHYDPVFALSLVNLVVISVNVSVPLVEGHMLMFFFFFIVF